MKADRVSTAVFNLIKSNVERFFGTPGTKETKGWVCKKYAIWTGNFYFRSCVLRNG